MAEKSILQEAQQIQMAIELISLGARLQLLERETCVSRGKLTKLFKEIKGISPPKGQLPFSADWFLTWEQNVHASLFYNIFLGIKQNNPQNSRTDTLIQSYRLYLDYLPESERNTETEPLFSLTRAWTLIRFVESEILTLTSCRCCGGKFITYFGQPLAHYTCPMCHPPSRALKRRQPVQAEPVRAEPVPAYPVAV